VNESCVVTRSFDRILRLRCTACLITSLLSASLVVGYSCVSKSISNIVDCSFNKNHQISIIFGVAISNTTGHQITLIFHLTQSLLPHYLGENE